MAKNKYESEAKFGETYRDIATGFEGVCTAVYFYQHGCERALLVSLDHDRKDVKENSFDVPGLVHVETDEQLKSNKTGGPGDIGGTRSTPARR